MLSYLGCSTIPNNDKLNRIIRQQRADSSGRKLELDMTTSGWTASEVTKGIGERIRAARQQARMTQRQLGHQIGVSGVSISDWERGVSQPSAMLLWSVANAVQKPATYFLPVSTPPIESSGGGEEEQFLRLFQQLGPELRLQTISFMEWLKENR